MLPSERVEDSGLTKVSPLQNCATGRISNFWAALLLFTCVLHVREGASSIGGTAAKPGPEREIHLEAR